MHIVIVSHNIHSAVLPERMNMKTGHMFNRKFASSELPEDCG